MHLTLLPVTVDSLREVADVGLRRVAKVFDLKGSTIEINCDLPFWGVGKRIEVKMSQVK